MRYVFDIKEDCNGKEALRDQRDPIRHCRVHPPVSGALCLDDRQDRRIIIGKGAKLGQPGGPFLFVKGRDSVRLPPN